MLGYTYLLILLPSESSQGRWKLYLFTYSFAVREFTRAIDGIDEVTWAQTCGWTSLSKCQRVWQLSGEGGCLRKSWQSWMIGNKEIPRTFRALVFVNLEIWLYVSPGSNIDSWSDAYYLICNAASLCQSQTPLESVRTQTSHARESALLCKWPHWPSMPRFPPFRLTLRADNSWSVGIGLWLRVAGSFWPDGNLVKSFFSSLWSCRFFVAEDFIDCHRSTNETS